MLRAIALAARLDFAIDSPTLDAIKRHRCEIARSSQPRLLEEYYKILRSGAAEKTFRRLSDVGLVEPISEELHHGSAAPLWQSLARLDKYRRLFEAAPDTLANPILLGSLLVPLGFSWRMAPAARGGVAAGPQLGQLPLARRDVERLRQILGLQRRLGDVAAHPRAQHALTHRSIFREALTWLEVHGGSPELVEHWTTMLARPVSDASVHHVQDVEGEPSTGRRRRRRRRRRFRPAPGQH